MENLLEQPRRSSDLPSAVWRNRFKVVLTFGLVILMTVLVTAFSKKQYVSESKLQIQVGRDSVALDPTATIGPFVGITDSRETEIQAIEELILSQPVLEKVIDAVGVESILGEKKWYSASLGTWVDNYNLNPFRVYDRREKAVRALRKDLEIAVPKGSKVITISYETDDAELTQKLVNAVVNTTINEHLELNHNKDSQEFFAREANKQHTKLSQMEKQLAELKTSTDLASVEDQRKAQIEQLAHLEDDISRTTAKMLSAEAEIAARDDVLKNLPSTVVTAQTSGAPNNPEDVMRAELFRLEIREKELATRFNEKNDQLMQVRDQIRLAKDVVDREDRKQQVTRGVNDSREKYEAVLRERKAELVGYKAQVDQLIADREAIVKRLHAMNNNALKIKEFEREIDLADAAYRKYKESFEITRIDEQRQLGKISNVIVLQKPSFSLQPSRPKYTLNAAIGLVLASLASIGVVVWAERTPRLSEASTFDREPSRLETTRAPRRDREAVVAT